MFRKERSASMPHPSEDECCLNAGFLIAIKIRLTLSEMRVRSEIPARPSCHFAKWQNNPACSVEVLRIRFLAFSTAIARTEGSMRGDTSGGGVRAILSFSIGTVQ